LTLGAKDPLDDLDEGVVAVAMKRCSVAVSPALSRSCSDAREVTSGLSFRS
jgi:hypothetical protein